jgi:hypothetical protein
MIGLMLDALTYVSRLLGPDLNRDTTANVRRAGFQILREQNVYFDIVRTIEALKIEPSGVRYAADSGAAVR